MRAALVAAALIGLVVLGCAVHVVIAPEETIEAAGVAASGVMPRLPARRASGP